MTDESNELKVILRSHSLFEGRKSFPHLLIAFAGIDGSGKSTQINHLAKWLHSAGLEVFPTKPALNGFTVVKKLAKQMTGDESAYYTIMPTTLHEFVISCDFVAHYFNIIEPQLKAGKTVICDRSSLCYRAYAKAFGADLTWIQRIYDLVPQPDITIFLDVPIDVSHQRLLKRHEKPLATDENPAFLNEVRKTYLSLIKHLENVIIIDASHSINEVQNLIREQLIKLLLNIL